MSKRNLPRTAARIRRSVALRVEQLEDRAMLAAYGMMLGEPVEIPDWVPEDRIPEVQRNLAAITSDAVSAPVYAADMESNGIVRFNDFDVDPQYDDADGLGYSVVIIDSGIDIDHPFFGPDDYINGTDPPILGSDGIADRIVYQQDYVDNDMDASDENGHGTHVASIAAGFQNDVYTGIAPAAGIIALRVLDHNGNGDFSDVKAALNWVIINAAAYNIAAVNMSLSDGENYQNPPTTDVQGIMNEISSINSMEIPVIAAAGNDFFPHNSIQGLAYPAADTNAISVGSTWDSVQPSEIQWGSGAIDHTTDVDRIVSHSQRHDWMLDVLAPGALINGANNGGGFVELGGTSMAAPHVAGTNVVRDFVVWQG